MRFRDAMARIGRLFWPVESFRHELAPVRLMSAISRSDVHGVNTWIEHIGSKPDTVLMDLALSRAVDRQRDLCATSDIVRSLLRHGFSLRGVADDRVFLGVLIDMGQTELVFAVLRSVRPPAPVFTALFCDLLDRLAADHPLISEHTLLRYLDSFPVEAFGPAHGPWRSHAVSGSQFHLGRHHRSFSPWSLACIQAPPAVINQLLKQSDGVPPISQSTGF